LVLFGATGDLAQRMLLPSLFALHADKRVAAAAISAPPTATWTPEVFAC
jgi:glucose-6-phosphate 1-dehydrogenase